MNIEIRRASIEDMDLLMQWRMEVLREVFSLSPNDSMEELVQENRAYYQTALPTEEHIACFAYDDYEIVGCGGICIYREMPSPDNPKGGCAYLMNIYTKPEFRNQGIGREIVNWLVQQAKQKGVTKIYLETSEIGKFLYKDMGFIDMCGYMQLK